MAEDMKAKMATMDDNIAKLRLKGKDLAIDARANWDNSSTLFLVDRLSPIDRNLKAPWPVRQTAENHKTPPLARRAELLGTIALH
jgi:hypothetical protein